MSDIEIAMEKIQAERQRQDDKWGADRMLDNYVWLAILTEEVGEAAEATLKELPEVEKEVVQIAAVAVAWLECLQRKDEQP